MAVEMASIIYTLATASETPSTYGITTDVLWSTDLGLAVFFFLLFSFWSSISNLTLLMVHTE